MFFQAGGMVVALWGRAELAADTVVEDAGGWGGVTLAQNLRSPEAVDALLEEAVAAGGTVRRPGAPTEWGGYGGVFSDPDGHCWEVAHNPFWTVTDDGRTLVQPSDESGGARRTEFRRRRRRGRVSRGSPSSGASELKEEP